MRSGNIQQSGADGTVETKSQPAAEGTTTPPAIPVMDLDNGIVGWESQKDPKMPLNFTPSHKWLVVALLSTLTFMTMFASSILAPTITAMARDYKEHSLTKVSMPVSIFLLGYAVGPLFLSPLSEIYGRHVVLVAANASFCAWLLACALAPSLNTLIFFRFMCGIGGSACQTIGGGVIADMFPLEQRGRAMSIWAMGPMFGPSIAPLIGGYTTETIGWKWTNWISFIPATIAVLLMSIFSRETNAIVLMQRKT
ncbi:MFS transporter, partial [Streptomyces eurythermus]|uniref:MFS transporter n=1 Tax=Streptomyces eurythermus TaxID=42237 RepID=UPI0033EE33FC